MFIILVCSILLLLPCALSIKCEALNEIYCLDTDYYCGWCDELQACIYYNPCTNVSGIHCPGPIDTVTSCNGEQTIISILLLLFAFILIVFVPCLACRSTIQSIFWEIIGWVSYIPELCSRFYYYIMSYFQSSARQEYDEL